jgi:hypothetical protein
LTTKTLGIILSTDRERPATPVEEVKIMEYSTMYRSRINILINEHTRQAKETIEKSGSKDIEKGSPEDKEILMHIEQANGLRESLKVFNELFGK